VTHFKTLQDDLFRVVHNDSTSAGSCSRQGRNYIKFESLLVQKDSPSTGGASLYSVVKVCIVKQCGLVTATPGNKLVRCALNKCRAKSKCKQKLGGSVAECSACVVASQRRGIFV